MSYDPERLSKKDKLRMTRIVLGSWWLPSLGVPAVFVLSVCAHCALSGVVRNAFNHWTLLGIYGVGILVVVPVNVLATWRRQRRMRHIYSIDGRACVMCGYTLLAEHDGQPCPECGAKADLARYRRLWIEFAGGWKQWPAELKKTAAKTPPAPEP